MLNIAVQKQQFYLSTMISFLIIVIIAKKITK